MNLESDGFAIIRDVISDAICDVATSLSDDTLRRKAGSRALLEHRWCLTLAQEIAADSKLGGLLPRELIAVQCTYFRKAEGINWLVAYHQDLSIPVRGRVDSSACTGWSEKHGSTFVQPPLSVLESLVAVRVHLDESTERNGPLRVIAGSHRYGRMRADDVTSHQASGREVVCTAARGSVLVFKPLLLHASSKAQEPSSRRVLHYLFGPKNLPEGLQWPAAT